MTKKKAFWLALATVGIPAVLIWGTMLYVIGMRENDWTFYASFTLLTVACLTPLVYRSYKNRIPSQKPTRDDYLKSAITTGCLGVAFSIIAVFHPEYRARSYENWLMPIAWFAITAIHLRNASKAEKTRYIPNE